MYFISLINFSYLLCWSNIKPKCMILSITLEGKYNVHIIQHLGGSGVSSAKTILGIHRQRSVSAGFGQVLHDL